MEQSKASQGVSHLKMNGKKKEEPKKLGMVSSVKLVCRDKKGKVKWTVEATDEGVKST